MAAPMTAFASGSGPNDWSISVPKFTPFVLPSQAKQSHGVLHNFLADVRTAATGIPMGLIDTGKALGEAAGGNTADLEKLGENIAESYKYMYGPVAEHPLDGSAYGLVLHRIGQHPLQPLLDAISIATLPAGGAGLAIKGASSVAQLGERVGIVSAETAERAERAASVFRGANYTKQVGAIAGAPPAFRTFADNPTTRAFQKLNVGTQLILSKASPALFGEEGKIFNLTDAGFQKRYLSQARSERAQAAASMIQREVTASRNLIKNPNLTERDIADALLPHIESVFKEHAISMPEAEFRAKGRKLATGWQFASETKKFVEYPENKSPQAFSTWVDGLGKHLTTTDYRRAAKDADGNYLVVRAHDNLNDFTNEAKKAYGALHALYTTPTKVWKWMVLATSPRYFVNNVIGNGFMFAMAANPVDTGRAMYTTISQIHGEHAANRALSDVEKAQRSITGDWVDRQYLATTQGFGKQATADLKLHEKAKSMKLAKGIAVAEGGLFGITHHISDTIPRRALINMFVRRTGLYRSEYQRLRKLGYSKKHAHEVAAEHASKDAGTKAYVVKNVNDVLGQYHHFNQAERGIKAVVPFYSWDRAIVRHAWHLSTKRPAAASALMQMGNQGNEETRKILGDIPSFMQGNIPLSAIGLGGHHSGILGFVLGDEHGDRVKSLMTTGTNPYSAVPDVLDAVSTLAQGNPQAGEVLSGQLNPLITGAIQHMTGQSLLSGKKLDQHGGFLQDVAENTLTNTPWAKLAQTEIEGRPLPHPDKRTGKIKEPLLYRGDTRQQLSSLLGLPIREASPEAAESRYRAEVGIKMPATHISKKKVVLTKSVFGPKSTLLKPHKPHKPSIRRRGNRPKRSLLPALQHKPKDILPKTNFKKF